MIVFEYRFDVLPGKLAEYEKYTKGPGKDLWLKYPGVKSYRVYKSIFGGSTPQRVIQVEVESLDALEKIFSDKKFQKAKEKFHSLVTNVSDSILTVVREGEKK
ncbi:MAG: hypothetical protein D6713_09995 [Deltaproteobacteria bacterium]|nr:MAG: hypothetical protein D6713_09995 [Deltaproteobacteria bacterium]